jgi:hypothetical protein
MHVTNSTYLCVQYEVGPDRDKVPLHSPRIRPHPASNITHRNSIMYVMEGHRRQMKDWVARIDNQQSGHRRGEQYMKTLYSVSQIIAPTPAVK